MKGGSKGQRIFSKKTISQPALNPNAPTFISHSSAVYCAQLAPCTMYEHGNEMYQTPPHDLPPGTQHYPTLSLYSNYPPSTVSTQSSPEVLGYPITGGLSELSPPPTLNPSTFFTSTSEKRSHDLSSCSDDSALQSDDNPEHDSLICKVRKQLEYYFSLENLTSDQYLVSQMDGDQFVPIWTVANFNAVKKLTTDIEVIKEALYSSKEVQIDSSGSKVRPIIRRCTLILRDISQHATPEEIASLFNNSPADCPPCIKCTFAHNNSWFVEFRTEHEALQAYQYFREHPHYFHGALIKVRIKAKPIQRSSTGSSPVPYNSHTYHNNVSCYPMVPMMWMSPSGMVPMSRDLVPMSHDIVPMDMNYPPSSQSYSNNVEYPDEYTEPRCRIRSADSANCTRRKARRNTNSGSRCIGGNWKQGDYRDRFHQYRSRHTRNDSDDSSTVSSVSSYNVPPASPDKHFTSPSNYTRSNSPNKHFTNPSYPNRNYTGSSTSNKNYSGSNNPNKSYSNSTANKNYSYSHKPNNRFTPSYNSGKRNPGSRYTFPARNYTKSVPSHTTPTINQTKEPALQTKVLELQTKEPELQTTEQELQTKEPELQTKEPDLAPSQFPPLSSHQNTSNQKKQEEEARGNIWCDRDKKTVLQTGSSVWPDNKSSHVSRSKHVRFNGDNSPATGSKADMDNRGFRKSNVFNTEYQSNWRRNPSPKYTRASKPINKKFNKPEHRNSNQQSVFKTEITSNSQDERPHRPTYSQITAKSTADKASLAENSHCNQQHLTVKKLCNGDIQTSSDESEHHQKPGKKTFSEVISSSTTQPGKPNIQFPTKSYKDVVSGKNNLSPVTITPEKPSESSDQSVQSPTTPKNEVICNSAWTRSSYRNAKPRRINPNNVYRVESKLNALDLEDSVFNSEKNQQSESKPDFIAKVNEEAPVSKNVAPTNDWILTKPTKQNINWFDDDDEDVLEALLTPTIVTDNVIETIKTSLQTSTTVISYNCYSPEDGDDINICQGVSSDFHVSADESPSNDESNLSNSIKLINNEIIPCDHNNIYKSTVDSEHGISGGLSDGTVSMDSNSCCGLHGDNTDGALSNHLNQEDAVSNTGQNTIDPDQRHTRYSDNPSEDEDVHDTVTSSGHHDNSIPQYHQDNDNLHHLNREPSLQDDMHDRDDEQYHGSDYDSDRDEFFSTCSREEPWI